MYKRPRVARAQRKGVEREGKGKVETRRCVQEGLPCKGSSASHERAPEGMVGAPRILEYSARGGSEHVNSS